MKVYVTSVTKAKMSVFYDGLYAPLIGLHARVPLIVHDVIGIDESGKQHSFESNDSLNVGDELEFVPRTWKDFFYDGPTITVDGKKYRMKN